MRRLAVPLALLAALTATAAPVPKESGADMLARVYGAVADPKSEVTCEPVGAGGLKVTLPKGAKVRQGEAIRPLVVREVEGDFVATVRVTHAVAADADRLTPAQAIDLGAGLAVAGEDADLAVGVFFTGVKAAKGWKGGEEFRVIGRNQNHVASGEWATDLGTPAYLRLTRRGDTLTAETSADGKRWAACGERACKGLGDTARIGPAAFQGTTGEYAVEFDHYELAPQNARKK